MKSPRWLVLAGMVGIFACGFPGNSQAQEPAPPATQAASPAESSSSAKTKKPRYSHANDFLISGTVFDPKGYAFPGVQLKIRRSIEKKFRWGEVTNSRGEFAVRVPKGAEYEMVVQAKGFQDQTRELDGKSSLSEARIVFRMEPGGGKKK